MRLLKIFQVAAVGALTLIATPAHAEADATTFLKLIDGGGTMALRVLEGYENGFAWADAELSSQGRTRLYCPPAKLENTPEQNADILRRFIRTNPSYASLPAGLALLRAYEATFPCSVKLSNPPFSASSNWWSAQQPPARTPHDLVLTVSVNQDGSLGWNGSPINDEQLRSFVGMVKIVPGEITTLLVLRPGVAATRRDNLIRTLNEKEACERDDKCILIENWSGDFPNYPPPPPPAPPRK